MSKCFCYMLVGISMMANVSLAQDTCVHRIHGKILSKNGGEPLAHAVVFVQGTTTGGVSDDAGFYELYGVCSDTLVLVCQYLGFNTVIDTLMVAGDLEHDFYPEQSSSALSEVTVVATGSDVLSKVKSNRLATTDRSLDENLGNSLMQIAGVTSLSTGAGISKPVIRGLHSNRVVIVNNGLRLEGQQWGSEHAPAVDPSLVGDIEVIKGAAGVRYGPEAIGGAVIMHPLALPDSFGIGGWFQSGLQSNGRGGSLSAMAQGRHAKLPWLRWRFNGTARKMGNQHTPDYFLNNTGAEELNFAADVLMGSEQKGVRVHYNQFNSNFGILSFSHIGNLSDLDRAIKAVRPLDSTYFSYEILPPFQSVEHEAFKVSGHVDTKHSGRLELIYGRQFNRRSEYDRHRNSSGLPAITFELTTHSLEVNHLDLKYKRHEFHVGGSAQLQENTYQGRFFIPNYRKLSTGLFVQDVWQRNDWQWILGARVDRIVQEVFLNESGVVRKDNFTFMQPSWSTSISKSWKSKYVVKLDLGSAWRPPMVNELYSDGLHHGAASYEIGDMNLNQEVAMSANLSFAGSWSRMEWRSDWYVSRVRDFIYLQPVQPPTLTIRGAFPTFQYQQADALLYGTDLEGSVRLGLGLSVLTNVSLFRAWNMEQSGWFSLMPPDQGNLMLHYQREMKGWTVHVQPGIQVADRQRRYTANVDYLDPPPAYALFNAEVGASKSSKKGVINIRLGVYNAFNHAYRSYMNRYRYFADEVGRNFKIQLSKTF